MKIIIFFLFFILAAEVLSGPFPKDQTLVLNVKNKEVVESSDVKKDETSIVLKVLGQSNEISRSVFTKEKIQINKGLRIRAAAQVALTRSSYSDGIAIVIQNHNEGSNYIGMPGKNKGLKDNSDCAITILLESDSYLTIQFANKVIYQNNYMTYYGYTESQIYFELKVLENDTAQLDFKIGLDKKTAGPTNPLVFSDFRKGLCFSEEQKDLSVFVGFSSSQFTNDCVDNTILTLFKMCPQFNCGCPLDPYFPLQIKYQNSDDPLYYTAYEEQIVLIEEPIMCDQCESFEGTDRNVYLVIDLIWKIRGTKKIINNISYLEYRLPYLKENTSHQMSVLIGGLTLSSKRIKIEPNQHISKNWYVPIKIPDDNNGGIQASKLPLTGFQNNKPTQPPSTPVVKDEVNQQLRTESAQFYFVEIYSRPIIKNKQSNQPLIEQTSERIHIQTIKIPLGNSEDKLQTSTVNQWIPSEKIKLSTDEYVLQGQSYEYEIKHENGSLIQTISTRPETALDTLYDGVCYGNYCSSSFFCKKDQANEGQNYPISKLDQICKEMEENPLGKLSTYADGAEELSKLLEFPFSEKISKLLSLNELYYMGKIALVKCDDIQCEIAKVYLIGKFLANTYTVLGKINLFSDLFSEFSDLGYYLAEKFDTQVLSKFTGDPHIFNLDGCLFDFQGEGDYILLQEKMIGFAIHTRLQQHSSFKDVTTIRSLAIRGFVGAPIVYFESLLDEKIPQIRVNGLLIQMSDDQKFELPNLTITSYNDNYLIKYSNFIEFQITNNGYGFLWTGFTRISQAYSKQLTGLLGNGDSVDDEKDFLPGSNTQDGYEIIKSCKDTKNSENVWKFGQSWRLTRKEESILYYKDNQTPDTFYNKDWKPKSKEQIIATYSQEQQNSAWQKCATLPVSDQDSCFLDVLLLQNSATTQIVAAYDNSKEPQKVKQVYLTINNIKEDSATLTIILNDLLYKYCQEYTCTVEMLYQQNDPNVFYRKYIEQFNKMQQITTKVLTDLDKKSIYTFKARLNYNIESSLFSIYTANPKCVPFCAKLNACGDDGCGGQCPQKSKCTTECRFGVCIPDKIKPVDPNNNNNNNNGGKDKSSDEGGDSSSLGTTAIVLISLSVVTVVGALVVLAIKLYQRKLAAKQLSQSFNNELVQSTISATSSINQNSQL